MHATPITPGRCYRVTGAGLDLHILAPDGFAAICAALELLEVQPC